MASISTFLCTKAAKTSWFNLVFVGFVLAFISGSIGVVGPDECFFFGPYPEEDRPDRTLLRLDFGGRLWMARNLKIA
jgi:hypothetical protein